MSNIPKRLFLYWGGGRLSYLRYCTIKSFKFFNPDWEILLYTPKKNNKNVIVWNSGEQSDNYTGRCWLDDAALLVDDVIIFDMGTLGFSNDISEVHKSDIIRLNLLSSVGGIWSDFDIIYCKKIPDAILEKDFLCFSHELNMYSIGFLGAMKNSSLYGMLSKSQLDIHNNNSYQIYGHMVFEKHKVEELQRNFNFNNIPMELVYPYNHKNINYIFCSPESSLPETTIGIHWYAGSSTTRHWENVLLPDNILEYDNLICNKISILENK